MPKRDAKRREKPSTPTPSSQKSEERSVVPFAVDSVQSEFPDGDHSEMDSLDSVLLASKVPRDAKIVALLLKSLGVENVGARVVPQFLEFMHNYVTEILREATTYAKHQQSSVVVKRKTKKSKKAPTPAPTPEDPNRPPKITLDDVRLATQARIHYSFIQPPPRELMLELSSSRNRTPIPLVPLTDTSVRLPPEHLCVRSYSLKTELPEDTETQRRQRAFDRIADPIGRAPRPPAKGGSNRDDDDGAWKQKK